MDDLADVFEVKSQTVEPVHNAGGQLFKCALDLLPDRRDLVPEIFIDALRLEEEDIPIPDRTRIPLDIKENYAEKPDHRGWDAIVKAMECVYPNQKNPKHFAPLLSAEFSGRDEPLEGISVYETVDYYHFVSFGMSEVFEKISDNPDISGFGMEFTLKLKKSSIDPAKEDIELRTICDILQKLGAISHNDGEFFHANEYIYTGQTTGFDAEEKTALTGFISLSSTSQYFQNHTV